MVGQGHKVVATLMRDFEIFRRAQITVGMECVAMQVAGVPARTPPFGFSRQSRLWIACGFVLLQSAQTGLLTPGWTALLAFFAVGTLGKTLAALARQEHMQRPQPMRLMLTA